MPAFNGRRDSYNFHVFIPVKASIYSDGGKKNLRKETADQLPRGFQELAWMFREKNQ